MVEALGDPLQDPATRLSHLQSYFLDIADNTTPLQRDTYEYVRHGGSLRLCLNEIVDLSEPNPQDVLMGEARADYMEAVLTKPRLRTRGHRARKISRAEDPYLSAVVSKIASVLDARTPEDALSVQQLPTVIEHASFSDTAPANEERLAANHLYLLMDIALKEHVARRAIIGEYRNRNRMAQILGNRGVRMGLVGTIFLAAVSPKIGMVPVGGEATTEDVELGVKVLASLILGLDAQEVIRMQYFDAIHNRRTGNLQEQMACDQKLSDLAFRMIYGSTRYGGSSELKVVTDRNGSLDREINLLRFARMEGEFEHLNNDPGGKPYTPQQAQGYAARLLIERQGQLQDLLAGQKSPEERRELFLSLSEQILLEDITRMKKGLSVSKVRKLIMRTIAFVPATFFPSATSLASEASTLSRDTAKAIKRGRD